MSNPYDYANTISKAAARARGTVLTPLHRVCEQQKTVSTRALSKVVDEIQDSLQLDAVHFKALADRIRKLEHLCKEMSDYLDTNELTKIAHGSVFHQQLKDMHKSCN